MKNIIFIISVIAIVSACSKEQSDTSQQATANSTVSKTTANVAAIKTYDMPASQADFEFARVARGGKLYKENCAKCHGANAEGTPDWRVRKPDGKLKPPPLNGTGHAWHHSKALLMSIITEGSIGKGGDMPAWGKKLTQDEIDAVLTWVQSKWPEEIYKNWLEINRR